MRAETRGLEWPTLLMMALTYIVWGLGTAVIWQASPVLAIVLTTIAIAQFSSLQHEVLHGHPFRSKAINEALVFAGLTLFIPYGRFRDTHLAHHHDPALTDPYDDPESNFLDPEVWAQKPWLLKVLLQINNTLLGRILLGPAFSIWAVVSNDVAAIRTGDVAVRQAWLLHVPGLAMVGVWLLAFGTMPVWAYVLSAYVGFGLLKIRTFLEHRAHETSRARSVIIEDRGPFSLLFLNNNFHAVHHSNPTLAWYKLPAHYAAKRDDYLLRNGGYVYGSYADIFRQFLFRAKDPVPHPVWPVKKVRSD